MKFTKMHGCGNDYIYVNQLEGDTIPAPESLAISLSNRNFGVGGDGLVLICPSEVADAKMRMFNLDGSEGKMCGNAIRCVAKYLYDNDICKKTQINIETLSGIKTLNLILENNLVSKVTVDMGQAEIIRERIQIEGQPADWISMGNPHCVVFHDNIESLNLADIGPRFENNPIFPDRANTEFVKVIDKTTLEMRVWERGSGETLACGTGACAAVVSAVLNGFCEKGDDVRVLLRGGELVINYTDERVLMTGEAKKVFEGTCEL